jgi:hypothetical protein
MQSHKNNNNKYYTSTAPCTTDPFITMGDKNKINADKLVKSCKSCVYFFVGKLINTVERFRDS